MLGHSYGCNKVIYYFYKKHPNILGVILASAPGMISSSLSTQSDEYDELLNKAKENINNNEPTKLLHKMIKEIKDVIISSRNKITYEVNNTMQRIGMLVEYEQNDNIKAEYGK